MSAWWNKTQEVMVDDRIENPYGQPKGEFVGHMSRKNTINSCRVQFSAALTFSTFSILNIHPRCKHAFAGNCGSRIYADSGI